MPAFLFAVALFLASTVISILVAKKPPNAAATGLSDFDFPQVNEGTPQTVYFGDCWTSDWTVLWYGAYSTQAIHAQGGKKI